MMKKLSSKGIKILKIIHLFFAVLWIGGGIALLVVLFGINPMNGDELYMKSRIIQLIDDCLIIPGALASFFIGIVYGIWTNWGFFKHRWITVKWVVTIAQILFGTFVLGPWVNETVDIANELRDAAMTDATLLHNIEMSQTYGTIQVIILVVAFLVVSVLKPWKKKKSK